MSHPPLHTCERCFWTLPLNICHAFTAIVCLSFLIFSAFKPLNVCRIALLKLVNSSDNCCYFRKLIINTQLEFCNVLQRGGNYAQSPLASIWWSAHYKSKAYNKPTTSCEVCENVLQLAVRTTAVEKKSITKRSKWSVGLSDKRQFKQGPRQGPRDREKPKGTDEEMRETWRTSNHWQNSNQMIAHQILFINGKRQLDYMGDVRDTQRKNTTSHKSCYSYFGIILAVVVRF